MLFYVIRCRRYLSAVWCCLLVVVVLNGLLLSFLLKAAACWS